MMSAPTDEPEAQLVAAARRGETTAWATLVERYYLPLLRYLTAQTRDPEAAADLTHDVLIAAGDLLQRLPADHLFAPWLYRIAQNHRRRLWRRQKVRRALSLDRFLDRAETLPPALQQPGDVAAATECADLVQKALNGLSPPLLEALLLSSVAGLTASEASATLGISLPAAERRISRAKEQFRIGYNLLLDEGTEP